MEKLFKKLTAKNLTTRLALLVVANATSSISLPAANFANPKVDGLIHRQWRRKGWPRRRCWLNRVDINHHSWSWHRRRRRKWRWSVSRRLSRSVSPSPGRRGCVRPGASHRHRRCARRWHRCARAFGGAALAVVAATPPVANAAAVAVPGTTKGRPRRLRWLGRHQDLRQEEEPVLHCQDKPKVQEEPKVLQEEPQVLLRAALPPLRP